MLLRGTNWLLWFSPHADIASLVVEFDSDDLRVTADRTVFDIPLFATGTRIDGNHDLLASVTADVGRLGLHERSGFATFLHGDNLA